ncbi:unnamed protein product [Amoebophrya sp. A120]|nr:unnamed protein product [Amoebophrya sp. A120]|eukprot:GSA120T00002381001.1
MSRKALFETTGLVTPNLDVDRISKTVARINGITQQIRAELEQASHHLDKAEHAGTMVRAITGKHQILLPPFPDVVGTVTDKFKGYSRGRWPSNGNFDALFL